MTTDTAIDKAVSLLVSFGGHGPSGIGVSELARRASLSKSTAFRVLALLERNGVVERLGREYRLGARLHELSRSVYAPEHDRIRDLLTPFVMDLYEETHETVHLAALHGTDVVYLSKLYGHRQVVAPSRVGGRVPAHAPGVGKAMLAHDPEATELVLAQRLVRFTTATVADQAALLRQLEEVRSTGIARDIEEVRPGLACLAAPVLDASGRPVAAISVSTTVARLDPQRLELAVRRAAGAASKAAARWSAQQARPLALA